MGLLRIIINRILEDVAAAFAAVSLVAMLAAQGGRFSDKLDIVTHFTPIFIVMAITAALLAALTRAGVLRRITQSLAAAAILLASGLILPEVLRDAGPRAEEAHAQPLTIVQMNSWGERNRTMGQTVKWILAQDPDIVIAQEASPRFQRAFERRADYHRTCNPEDRCEVVIYSKAKPVSVGVESVNDGVFFPTTRATFSAPGGDFTVIGAHFTWPIPPGVQQQQSRRLAAIASRYDSDRLIIAGDFNSTPWSFSLRRQDEALGLKRRNKAMLTWPAMVFSRWNIRMRLPFLAIDHVYAGADWRTVSVERGPALGSDHFPVVVKLALSPDSGTGARSPAP